MKDFLLTALVIGLFGTGAIGTLVVLIEALINIVNR